MKRSELVKDLNNFLDTTAEVTADSILQFLETKGMKPISNKKSFSKDVWGNEVVYTAKWDEETNG